MQDVLYTKSALRSELRARRTEFVGGLEALELDGAFSTLPRQLWPLFSPAAVVGLYLPLGAEAPTAALIDFVRDSRRDVALPRIDDGAMCFHAWSPGEPLEGGPHKVRQPAESALASEPDLLFAPLLGFDRRLRRLGQGGGHYDRWLAAHPAVRVIGVGWSAQEVDRMPTEPHDRPMDAVLTERSVLMRPDI